MGLCKCPKRKVTNLFCFEHRVNVCEYCLIENHPKCIVQSYLNWLKDSDYVPNCALCNYTLTEGEVIRLLCYDVFHISCLEKHYRSLPSNTAPAGYRCYSCDSPVFPQPNQAGYVTEHLREVLAKYNWARVGLCLPLIDEPKLTEIDNESSKYIEDHDNDSLHGSTLSPAVQANDSFASQPEPVTPPQNNLSNTYSSNSNFWEPPNTKSRTQHRQAEAATRSTVLSLDEMPPSLNNDMTAVPRKMIGEALPSFGGISLGEDPDGANKYKRRSAFSWLRRWLKSRLLRGRGYHDNRSLPRRTVVLLLIALLALLTFIVFATKVARRPGNDDPNFDPMLNPNIHVARHKAEAVPAFGKDEDIDIIDPLQLVHPGVGQ